MPRASAPIGTAAARALPALCFLPSLFALIFFGFIASDRYVSEAQFIVRTASKPLGSTGFTALLQMTGLSRSQDDVYSVKEFLTSRDAIRRLNEAVPLKEVYGNAAADWLSKYPSFVYGNTLEELHSYFRWMILTSYSTTTGLTTLRVQAFTPAHAKAVADKLLDLGEETVNRLNQRIQEDAVRATEQEVARSERRLVDAQLALTAFRNREATIDPASSSVILSEVIAGLSTAAARLQAQLRESTAAAPDSPQIPALRKRLAALEGQMIEERRRFAKEGGGLAAQLAAFERLSLDLEFAKTQLATSVRNLETARNEARRQQLYLERVVEPSLPDYPMAPSRLRSIATAFVLNLVAFMVLWLLFAGIRERMEEQHLG